MIQHHPSRPFRPLAEDVSEYNFQDAPSVQPGLVEHLQETFALQLAPERQGGLDGAVNIATQMAEQRGREEVIAYLNVLANRK